MSRDRGKRWLQRLTSAITPAPAAPSDVVPQRGQLNSSDHVACVALSHRDAPEAELRALVNGLRSGGYAVAIAHREPSQLAPLQDVMAVDAEIISVESPTDGPFALWQTMLAALGPAKRGAGSRLLISTHLRGPFQRGGEPSLLRKLLKQVADFSSVDVWGLTESWTDQFHLSTSFMSVGPNALAHPAWASFWSGARALPSNSAAERRLETELTQTLLEAGLIAAAAFPYQALLDGAGAAFAAMHDRPPLTDADRARAIHLRRIRTLQANRTPMEPMSFFWQELLDLGAPFVTRDLVERNPYGIVTARQCAEWLRAGTLHAPTT